MPISKPIAIAVFLGLAILLTVIMVPQAQAAVKLTVPQLQSMNKELEKSDARSTKEKVSLKVRGTRAGEIIRKYASFLEPGKCQAALLELAGLNERLNRKTAQSPQYGRQIGKAYQAFNTSCKPS